MKKLLAILAVTALALSLCVGAALAADSGEIIIDWQPASLGDDPSAPEYSNVYRDPVETFAAEHPEEYAEAVAELEQWALEEGLDPDSFDVKQYLAEALPMAASETASVTTPSTRKANDPNDLSHYYSTAADYVAVGKQGNDQICWAVAALDCLHIGAQQQGISLANTLSADHLVYYAYHGFTNSLSNSERDYITPADQRGNVYASMMTLASWGGPSAVFDKNKEADIHTDNALWLKNGYWLNFSGSSDRDAVKAAVQKYGAVAASLIAASKLSSGTPYYNSDTCAYCYTETDLTANYTDHEVVIVGWDDNYSAENFKTKPLNEKGEALNGAWLCRNTWGSDWGNDGYFWLSYYDTGLCQNGTGLVLDAGKWGEGKNIYQYDCNYTLFTTETVNASSVTIANVYTCGAESHEILSAVGTYTTVPNTAYTVEIYVGLTDGSDPYSGRLTVRESGTFSYAGYQTHTLSQQPYLTKGEKFAVVYTLTFPTATGNKVPVSASASATGSDGTTMTAHTSANAGESFRLSGSTWTDRGVSANHVNYRIKAITEPDTTERTWDAGTVVTAADCTNDGLKLYASGTVVKTEIIPAGHTLTHTQAKSATAVANGNIEYWHCSDCDKYFSDSAAATAIEQSKTVIAATGFTDVSPQRSYYPQVIWAVENGITEGMTATEFLPYDYCTRAQIVTFLWRCAGEPEPTITSTPFTDIRVGSFYYKAVLWAVEKGIAKGMTTTTFCPHEYCTRAHMVTFLWRAQGCPDPTGSKNPFTDLRRDYYYTAVLWGAENGIVKGETTTTFVPNDYCQRWQAVLFLHRTYAEE